VWLNDWLSWGSTSHSTQNKSFRSPSSQPISWLSTEKLKQTQQSKHASVTTYNIKWTPQKLKPGLVDSYDFRPGNGEGLFWFWCFINLSLTYLLRHMPTWSKKRRTGGQFAHGPRCMSIVNCYVYLLFYSQRCIPVVNSDSTVRLCQIVHDRRV